MNFFKLLPLITLIGGSIFAQDAARNWTVQLSAETTNDPATITLNWLENEQDEPTNYYVFRKVKGTTDWGIGVATLPAETLTFTDEDVEIGVSYEYYIQLRSGSTIYAWGYLNSGIQVELEPNKGDLLLVVDNTVEADLIDEIATLEQDLYKDGWMVTTISISPDDSPEDLKDEIIAQSESLPNLTALYLLGNVPVPYSGELYPDAHDNHIGAWPADVYYADLDGEWTDSDVDNTTAASPRNHNVPGDGKFDQSKVPSKLELQVSRVDFSNLPVYSETEAELLSNYLNKAHEFKTAAYIPSDRGLVDQGTFTGLPEGFAQNGFRNFTGFFGPENVDHIDYWSNLNGNDYLWSYGCGAGSYTSAAGLNDGSALTSAGIVAGYSESTFTMLFGSYFGDWDVTNNLMRVAVANGRTLSCSWAARPNWHYHTMAMGESIGYSVKMSQDFDSEYLSLDIGGPSFTTTEGVHVAQLGDPSLRMYYVEPPEDVEVFNEGSRTLISWSPSPDDDVEGYNVYRRKTDELWVKVNETGIVDSLDLYDYGIADAGEYEFLVKSVKLKTNGSGTFYNESIGAIGNSTFYVGLEETPSLDFSVYPNPNRGQFTIKAGAAISSVVVLGLDGRIVYTALPNVNKIELELDGVNPGVYLVKVEINGETQTERIMIH